MCSWLNIGSDLEQLIFSMYSGGGHQIRLTDRTMNSMYIKKRKIEIARIQRWWRRYRLVLPYPPVNITRKTMIRYYIAKYNTKWIAMFPKTAIKKLYYLEIGEDDRVAFSKVPQFNVTSHFRAFCLKYMTIDNFYYYGW